MTDKEIIKALECCGRESCYGCPYREKCHQGNPMIRDALDLINRKKEEVEALVEQLYKLKVTYDCELAYRKELHKIAKSEAIKEFADELCKGRVSNDPVVIAVQAELNMKKGKAKPEKCDCFCEKQRIKGWLNSNTPITEPITVCNGTRERDECTCGGDKSKCDFYPKDYSYGY